MAQHIPQPALSPALTTFATVLREEIGACRVLLFGSHARGDARPDSDLDLIIVAERFAGMDPQRRAIGLRSLWYAAGGDSPMDLICVSPDEFARAQQQITLVAAVLPEAIDL